MAELAGRVAVITGGGGGVAVLFPSGTARRDAMDDTFDRMEHS